MGSGDEFWFCTKDKVELMGLLKAFFYKNDCVLCVWARYCLFVLLGAVVAPYLGTIAWVIFVGVFTLLLIFFVLLAWLPTEDELYPKDGDGK